MSRSRNLLHADHLTRFVEWARENGYIEHPTRASHGYEVARLELYDPAGNHPHIVIYSRLDSVHLTVFGEGVPLIERFLKEKRLIKQIRRSDNIVPLRGRR